MRIDAIVNVKTAQSESKQPLNLNDLCLVSKSILIRRKNRNALRSNMCWKKKCVDYFDKSVSRMTGSLEMLVGDMPLSVEGIYLLGKFINDSFPLQAVRLHCLYEGSRPVLSYGDCPQRSPYEWLTAVENFPKELWLSVDDYPRPTCPALLLCEYGGEHYEVVKYENKTWITQLCFPVKPTRYFVLNFLKDKE